MRDPRVNPKIGDVIKRLKQPKEFKGEPIVDPFYIVVAPTDDSNVTSLNNDCKLTESLASWRKHSKGHEVIAIAE